MTQETIVLLPKDTQLTLEELAMSCTVTPEWVIEHVQAGVLLTEADPEPRQWAFTRRDLMRALRICAIERDFDANPELAGLVADLLDEVQRLRIRLHRAGLSAD